MMNLPATFTTSSKVSRGLGVEKTPVVGLESCVITHGLPIPENFQLALQMESAVRARGAVPVTIAVLQGKIHLGLNHEQMKTLAGKEGMKKISIRDLAPAISLGWSGGTTVAASIAIAHQAGIRVFATGGIGGVHRGNPMDISADLVQLAQRPVIVVCSGAKIILDIPATRELLETSGVPVIGYRTDEFPGFYSKFSGVSVDLRVENVEQAVRIAHSHWSLGFNSAILLVVPPPDEVAIPYQEIQHSIDQALVQAKKDDITGNAITPYLLNKINELTEGRSLRANLGLLIHNAQIAAQIACALTEFRKLVSI